MDYDLVFREQVALDSSLRSIRCYTGHSVRHSTSVLHHMPGSRSLCIGLWSNLAWWRLFPVALWGPQWAGPQWAGPQWAGHHVLLMMHLLRCFAFYASYYRFHFSTQHIPGVLNVAADETRCHCSPPLFRRCRFFHVPKSLHDLLIAVRPDWGSSSWTHLLLSSLGVGSPLPHN